MIMKHLYHKNACILLIQIIEMQLKDINHIKFKKSRILKIFIDNERNDETKQKQKKTIVFKAIFYSKQGNKNQVLLIHTPMDSI